MRFRSFCAGPAMAAASQIASWFQRGSESILQSMSCVVAVLLLLAALPFAQAQMPQQAAAPLSEPPPLYGPYNGTFLPGGAGLNKSLPPNDPMLTADAPWSISCWVRSAAAIHAPVLVGGVGIPREEYSRFFVLGDGRFELRIGENNSVSAAAAVNEGEWHLLAATFDGSAVRLYVDGALVKISSGLVLGSVAPWIEMAPVMPERSVGPDEIGRHFGGQIAAFTLQRRALTADELKIASRTKPDPALLAFEDGSKSWPVQTRGQAGYRAPQDPSTLPRTNAPFSRPVAQPLPTKQQALRTSAENEWTLAAGWKLSEAPKVSADAAAMGRAGFDTREWLAATVPGTVLTTMVDRGVYPDPDYGLNNLAIPETLNKQDYWYRNEFNAPAAMQGKRLTLTFEGVNYRAVVWLNGRQLGTVTGAFIRGVFDVSSALKPGQANVLLVRVSPPPHPGIPQEQSIKGGPGENGGAMCLDGPTFVASEGWDWIPAVRDRETGIWQPVTITATGAVKIGDAQVVTRLPLPSTESASVEITVPLENSGSAALQGTLTASFENASVVKTVSVAPGASVVKLTPAEFAQLKVEHPRLWWPNGYGKPELYHLKLIFAANGQASDTRQTSFGIREVTYELSLLDSKGELRRVEYSPTEARGIEARGIEARGSTERSADVEDTPERVVDVSHEGMREIPFAVPFPPNMPEARREGMHSWVSSLAPGGESSPSIRSVSDTGIAPYLAIKVNGVRIAARGGNWGMDDSRKRVSRERLEPYFRLNRDANLNIIRNWVGQNTEESFYELADEYGMMVWNDFWESTENYNIEAQDPALFLKNARDTIQRFRNHPSIVMWCGRNEGVPQPIINSGLDDLVRSLDGTRYYSPSSNAVNLQDSGPYRYQDPKLYYTALNRGFSVETGTPSLSTLESFQHWIPEQDQWPISDDWAYHDWHQTGNGATAPFMEEVQAEFGAGTSLADFERKAQMLNYVDHRAIFEGMNAHLWSPNSGRLLWMTQPAWPSNMWQILSSDYDTQASYYGTKKACEPVHVQLDLSSYNVDVVNTTTSALGGATASARVYSLDNRLLLSREQKSDVASDSSAVSFNLDLQPLLAKGLVLVKLELRDAQGSLLSDNLYWLGEGSASYRALNDLPPANLAVTATMRRHGGPDDHGAQDGKKGGMVRLSLQIANHGTAAALENKLTLVNAADGSRILPAYYSDNYISLLPGETREIEIDYPLAAAAAGATPAVHLRGWNLEQRTVKVALER